MALGLTQASYDFMFTGFEIGRNFIGLDFKNLGSELIFFLYSAWQRAKNESKKKKRPTKETPKFVFFTVFPFFPSFVELQIN